MDSPSQKNRQILTLMSWDGVPSSWEQGHSSIHSGPLLTVLLANVISVSEAPYSVCLRGSYAREKSPSYLCCISSCLGWAHCNQVSLVMGVMGEARVHRFWRHCFPHSLYPHCRKSMFQAGVCDIWPTWTWNWIEDSVNEWVIVLCLKIHLLLPIQ